MEDSDETDTATEMRLDREQTAYSIETSERLISDIELLNASRQQYVKRLQSGSFLSSMIGIFKLKICIFFQNIF